MLRFDFFLEYNRVNVLLRRIPGPFERAPNDMTIPKSRFMDATAYHDVNKRIGS